MAGRAQLSPLRLLELPSQPATPAVGEQLLYARNGAVCQLGSDGLEQSLGGGATAPSWAGNLHQAFGDGEPDLADQIHALWGPSGTSVTPTNLGITAGRVWTYYCPYAISVQRLRWYQVAGTGATSFRFAIYQGSNLAQVLASVTLTPTAANAWASAAVAPLALAANTLYYCVLAATVIGTTYSIRASGTPAIYPPLPAITPGNLATNAINPNWFGQVAVAAGVMPSTLPTLSRGSSWTGGIPAFYFDSNSAA